jgi:hypothetical protein
MAEVAGANVPLIPTTLLVAGGYIAWFAVHYWRDTTQAYPSGPVKSVLTGKGLPKPIREGSAADANATGFTNLAATLSQTAATVAQANTSSTAGGPANTQAGTVHGNVSGKTQYSRAELGQLWTNNGGDPAKVEYATGIAEAESSGYTLSNSSNPDGGTNWGLWQLDTKGVGAGYPVDDLTNADKSTQITIMATRNGTDWADWANSYTAVHGHKGIV